MGGAFSKAFGQLPDPAVRRVLLRSLALTLLLFAGLAWAGFAGLDALPQYDWDWINDLVRWFGAVGLLIVLFVLFPAFATLLVSLFLDEIASAVEARYYASDEPGKAPRLRESLMIAARFTVAVVLLNIAALPIYLLLFWFPAVNVVIFYSLNGYLLGREYFELVAQRHMATGQIRKIRRIHQSTLLLTGVIIMFMLTIPVLNLVVPVVATAAMVHVFKALTAEDRAPDVAVANAAS